jgi:tellurite resistance protein TerC
VLIRTFHWMLYVFGVLLVATSAKLFLQKEQKAFSKDSKTYKWLSKILPLTQRKAEGQFVVHEQGKRKFTTLFLVLIGIELSDILFAIDSIPAVFAVTNDPFIAYTSNVFAILGLRALYFCLSPLLSKLQFIRYGLALILLFVGAKMLIGDLYPISTLTSLIVILAILLITALLPLSKRFKAS